MVMPGQLEGVVLLPLHPLSSKLAASRLNRIISFLCFIYCSRVFLLGSLISNLLWDRVDPSRIEGIAPQDASEPHPTAFENAVLVNCLIGVVGTSGIKTAGV